MFSEWDSLVRAAYGPGRPRPDTSLCAHGPTELAGVDHELADVVDRVPTRRLVLLGEAGSGKTTALVRFVVDRLATRAPGGKIPVLVSLSTWDPAKDFFSWLEERLLVAHPYLGRQVGTGDRTGKGRMSMARALLESGRILPVLDGLDETPEHFRAGVLAAVNHALMPEHPLVISSRTAEFRVACLAPDGGTEICLDAAVGVELLPVEPDAVEYDCAGQGVSEGGPHRGVRPDQPGDPCDAVSVLRLSSLSGPSNAAETLGTVCTDATSVYGGKACGCVRGRRPWGGRDSSGASCGVPEPRGSTVAVRLRCSGCWSSSVWPPTRRCDRLGRTACSPRCTAQPMVAVEWSKLTGGRRRGAYAA